MPAAKRNWSIQAHQLEEDTNHGARKCLDDVNRGGLTKTKRTRGHARSSKAGRSASSEAPT